MEFLVGFLNPLYDEPLYISLGSQQDEPTLRPEKPRSEGFTLGVWPWWPARPYISYCKVSIDDEIRGEVY